MNPSRQNEQSDHSDSDDWLLVSKPGDSNENDEFCNNQKNGSTKEPTIELPQDDSDDQEASKQFPDDGLTEIDLNESSQNVAASILKNKNKLDSIAEDEDDDDDDDDDKYDENEPIPASEGSSSPLSMSEFQVVDGTTDDDDDDDELEALASTSSSNKRQSLSDSDLSEYVDFGRKRKKKRVVIVEEPENRVQHFDQLILHQDGAHLSTDKLEELTEQGENVRFKVALIKERLNEIKRAIASERRGDYSNASLSELFNTKQNKYFFIVSALAFGYLSALIFFTITLSMVNHQRHQMHQPKPTQKLEFPDLSYIPTSQQFKELKSLSNDLIECVKRQHPASFSCSYSSTSHNQRHQDCSSYKTSQDRNRGVNNEDSSKRNLVCYGHVSEWRKRFERLKTEHGLDLAKLVEDARRRITNDVLEKHNPAFQFKLILNQLEYLEFLKNKQQKKQNEDTIKQLRAQNLQLLMQLNNSNDYEASRKLVSNLELKNSILLSENKALKASLMQKAGPTFIKQSHELEKLEAENHVLKQFHHEVAKEIAGSLRQMSVHTVDAYNNLDDLKSLNSQLLMTRMNLKNLKDKISTILLENESLKEELKESQHSSALSSVMKMPSDFETRNLIMRNKSNDHPLTINSCMRDLIKSEKRAALLEEEVVQLKRNCQRGSFGLQQSSGSSLNKTSFLTRNGIYLNQQPETAVEKPNLNAYSLKGNDIYNDMIAISFLHDSKNDLIQPIASTGYLRAFDDKVNNDKENQIKVLPNYIRETYTQKFPKESSSLEISTPKSIINNNNAALTLNNAEVQLIDASGFQKQSHPSALSASNASSLVDEETLEQIQMIADQVESFNNKVQEIFDSVNRTFRDSWFFKRAKQRKELRMNRENVHRRAKSSRKLTTRDPICLNNYYNNNHNCRESVRNDIAIPQMKPKLLSKSNQNKRSYYDRKQQEKASARWQKYNNKKFLHEKSKHNFRDEL